jgi:hypothetical protein
VVFRPIRKEVNYPQNNRNSVVLLPEFRIPAITGNLFFHSHFISFPDNLRAVSYKRIFQDVAGGSGVRIIERVQNLHYYVTIREREFAGSFTVLGVHFNFSQDIKILKQSIAFTRVAEELCDYKITVGKKMDANHNKDMAETLA